MTAETSILGSSVQDQHSPRDWFTTAGIALQTLLVTCTSKVCCGAMAQCDCKHENACARNNSPLRRSLAINSQLSSTHLKSAFVPSTKNIGNSPDSWEASLEAPHSLPAVSRSAVVVSLGQGGTLAATSAESRDPAAEAYVACDVPARGEATLFIY